MAAIDDSSGSGKVSGTEVEMNGAPVAVAVAVVVMSIEGPPCGRGPLAGVLED